ncbi:MAG: hypothetical protein ABIO35_08415 [Nitrobacter sp.]
MTATNQEVTAAGRWKQGQWPDSICSGFITYRPSEYGGYMFCDASHGIPVLGHINCADQVRSGIKMVYHGSYPDQAEMIARRLTACWNACANRPIEDLEAEAARKVQGL